MSYTHLRKATRARVAELEEAQINNGSELSVFANVLRTKLRGIKFYHRSHGSVWVAYPDDVWAMGYIGHGAVQKTTADEKYYVYSRLISNEKYPAGDRHHFMKLRSSVDAAVKVACQYLRPFTTAEHVCVHTPAVEDIIGEHKYQFEREEQQRRNELLPGKWTNEIRADTDVLMMELCRAVEQGYQPTDLALPDKLVQWHKAFTDKQSVCEGKIPATVIMVNPDDTFTFGKINDIGKPYFIPEPSIPMETVSRLPEDIEGKVAVLSMVEPNLYVAGVGLRLDDRMFYVTDK